jgi:purine-binding chemotaxis protein CheW
VADPIKVLCFFVGEQEFATAITHVREVIDPLPITYIPHTPGFVLGVINLRGSIIAVLSLRRFLELGGASPAPGQEKIMILSLDGRTIGAMTDRISRVRALDPEGLDPPPATLGHAHRDVIRGVMQLQDHPLVFLDLGAIVESPQLKPLME